MTHLMIAIGASTGGPEAVREVLSALPADTPGVVIVQHMPPVFTASFASRLNSLSAMHVKEAVDGDRVIRGQAIIAPGNLNLSVVKTGGEIRVHLNASPHVNWHRPSVDVLFNSVAEQVGSNAIGVILTGMGVDGAQGLKNMRDAGARTIAQDAATSVVYGMPREAIALGGAEIVLPLGKVAEEVIRLTHSVKAAA